MSKLYVNIDSNDYASQFLNNLVDIKDEKGDSISRTDMYPFIDLYANTNVTDIMLCINCQRSLFESKVFTDVFDKHDQTVENGIAVDYKKSNRGIYTVYKEYGIDPFDVWFARCKEMGITPWASIRMNDCHFPFDATSNWRTDFFYEAQRNGWIIGNRFVNPESYKSGYDCDYYQSCLDYSVEQVRNKFLDYIDEVLSRYDVDGIEYDFMREIRSFDYVNQRDKCEIINDFMQKAKAIVTKYEKKYNHPIKTAIRLMRDVLQNKEYGFDIITLTKNNLVDTVVVSPRWETNDSDMPIPQWKEVLPNTEILACIDTQTVCGSPACHSTADVVRGYCNRYLSDGADGMYLFNYYVNPLNTTSYGKIRGERSAEIFNTCGSLEQVQRHPMRFIVTEQDTCPEGCQIYKPLPIELDGNEKVLAVSVGKILTDATVNVIIGIDSASAEQLKVTANGKPLPAGLRKNPKPADMQEVPADSQFPCNCGYIKEGTLTYEFPLEREESGKYNLAFNAPKGKITYVEINIE